MNVPYSSVLVSSATMTLSQTLICSPGMVVEVGHIWPCDLGNGCRGRRNGVALLRRLCQGVKAAADQSLAREAAAGRGHRLGQRRPSRAKSHALIKVEPARLTLTSKS